MAKQLWASRDVDGVRVVIWEGKPVFDKDLGRYFQSPKGNDWFYAEGFIAKPFIRSLAPGECKRVTLTIAE